MCCRYLTGLREPKEILTQFSRHQWMQESTTVWRLTPLRFRQPLWASCVDLVSMRAFLTVAFAVFVTASVTAESASTVRFIAAVPIAGAPEGARAYRIVYHSADSGDRPIDVTGVVIIPAGDPPAAGRDIVARAHGTSGIVDDCAPSTNSWLFSSIAGLSNVLNQNSKVGAPDRVWVTAITYLATDEGWPYLAVSSCI